MSRAVKARQTLAAATRTPVELTPLRKMIRLPVVDAMPHLTSGPAAIRLPLDVVSLEYRYHPKHTSIGSKQFMAQYAPQIAYNNPHIPFTFTRSGKAPVIKPASAATGAPAPKAETTASVDAEAIEAEETSGEPELKKYELAPSSLILSLKNGQTRTIETKDAGLKQILAELLNIVNVAGGPQVDAPEKLPALEAPAEEAAPQPSAP